MRKGLTEYLGFYRKDATCLINFARDNLKLLVINKYIKVLLNLVKPLILHPFICKGLYHVIANKSRRSLVYHPRLVAVYHQPEVLYLSKPQEYAPSVMIYASRR